MPVTNPIKLKFLLIPQLRRFLDNIKQRFVAKEMKTGSTTEYKVLSDNNLTDELVRKINDAGTSNFGGTYSELTGKPTIDGKALEGAMTTEGLGIASRAWVNQQRFDTTSSVDGKIASAKDELQDSMAASISAVYKPKGSCAIADLPAPSTDTLGFVYNINTVFATTDQFVEGAGLSYPAGTNVACVNPSGSEYKWDVLSGSIDLTPYVKDSDIEYITDAEIDALFA